MSEAALTPADATELTRAARLFSACNYLFTGNTGCFFWLRLPDAGLTCWWVEYGDQVKLRRVRGG